MIDNAEDLQRWFKLSGVPDPLAACMGPLPRSGASLARWTSKLVDQSIRTMQPHSGNYRLSLMLAPLEARIWAGRKPVHGGMIGANRFRICPPGDRGLWSQMSSCDIVNIFIPTELVDRLGTLQDPDADPALGARSFGQDRMVLDLVHKMLDAQVMSGGLAQEACDGLMTTLVCHLLDRYAKPADRMDAGGLAGIRLRRVLKHIADSSGEAVPNAELADLCGMSPAHFSREFRRAVGLPPHQYMMKLRLERAREALLAHDARVLDVAQDCGFSDASHFSRAFSGQYGMSPATFRSQQRRALIKS